MVIAVLLAALSAGARAQDPAPVPPAAPAAPTEVVEGSEDTGEIIPSGEPVIAADGTPIIIVYDDLRVERARQALIRDLKEQGFTTVIDKGDYLVLRHEAAWKGEVIVHDDGWVRMKRQPARIESPDFSYAKKGSALAWAHCVVIPTLCMRVGGQTLSRRRWLAVSEDTMGEISPDAAVFGDRVADKRTGEVIEALPDRLTALWEQGTPLTDDGAPLGTVEERKAAILAYWESRTDTVWGDRVRAVLDAFIRAEIQHSDHPFTPAEIAAFNEQRHCERTFDLTRDWDAVLAAEGDGG